MVYPYLVKLTGVAEGVIGVFIKLITDNQSIMISCHV